VNRYVVGVAPKGVPRGSPQGFVPQFRDAHPADAVRSDCGAAQVIAQQPGEYPRHTQRNALISRDIGFH